MWGGIRIFQCTSSIILDAWCYLLLVASSPNREQLTAGAKLKTAKGQSNGSPTRWHAGYTTTNRADPLLEGVHTCVVGGGQELAHVALEGSQGKRRGGYDRKREIGEERRITEADNRTHYHSPSINARQQVPRQWPIEYLPRLLARAKCDGYCCVCRSGRHSPLSRC